MIVSVHVSAGGLERLTQWWEVEAETRLEPGGLLILQGQRLGRDDLYRWATGNLAIETFFGQFRIESKA